MKQEMISITKEEYNKFQHLKKVEWDVVGKFKQALNNLKNKNYKEL